MPKKIPTTIVRLRSKRDRDAMRPTQPDRPVAAPASAPATAPAAPPSGGVFGADRLWSREQDRLARAAAAHQEHVDRIHTSANAANAAYRARAEQAADVPSPTATVTTADQTMSLDAYLARLDERGPTR